MSGTGSESLEEQKTRVLIEKKTVINLLEAFAVAVKHYLRGEDSIYYQDLYHLVKFLPAYALPLGIPSKPDLANEERTSQSSPDGTQHIQFSGTLLKRTGTSPASDPHLPMPVSTASPTQKSGNPQSPREKSMDKGGDGWLFPARLPPKYSLFDLFPFSLMVKMLTRRGKEVTGKTAARLRARTSTTSHNIPLEISLYLASIVTL